MTDDRAEPVAASVGSPGPSGRRIGLKRRADFVAAAQGRRAHASTMTLQAFRRPADTTPSVRFGLTVTKKVGSAVERNRIKRRLRQVLRVPDLALQPGHDYVIVARRDALTCAFGQLVADLTQLIDQSRHGRSRPRNTRTAERGAGPDRPRRSR